MPKGEIWRGRWRTGQAMAWLCLARLLVALVPLRRWRGSLGLEEVTSEDAGEDRLAAASALARRVERAAGRLPMTLKCLPQAMALSWMLRRKRIAHRVVIAIRPPGSRDREDALHAWVEVLETTVLGDLPGPWHIVFRAPDLSTSQKFRGCTKG